MAKTPGYVCTSCGAAHARWSGRCDACGAWNAIQEAEALSAAGPAKKSLGARRGKGAALTDLSAAEDPPPRARSGISELDRVLGGGLVPASATLVGGDPGIGKSTLLLQTVGAPSPPSRASSVDLRISGEESDAAKSACAGPSASGVADATCPAWRRKPRCASCIIDGLMDGASPEVVMIDSIQTHLDGSASAAAPGTVAQVRACRAGADALCQEVAAASVHPGRPRHQGRPDRRPPRGRTHGRRRALFRGRPSGTSSESCAPTRTASAPPTRSASSR